MTPTADSRNDVERAAILLLTLGEQDAARVLKHLDAKSVQRVGAAMAQVAGVSREEVSSVLIRFSVDVEQKTSLGVDSSEYVRKVLTEALGAEKASGVIERIVGSRAGRGLENLKWMEGHAIAEMLRREHPQIIANVLCHLEPDQAADVLRNLPDALRPDIVMRIATLDGVNPTALSELDQVLEQQFAGSQAVKSTGVGGPKVAAAILNVIGSETEGPIMKDITEADAPLAEALQDLMLVFEDLRDLSDRDMQALLREVAGEQLITALKAADESLREKFLKNMSSRAAETLREDLANKGPTRLSEVEAAQKEILVSARRMAAEGTLQLGGKGGGEYV